MSEDPNTPLSSGDPRTPGLALSITQDLLIDWTERVKSGSTERTLELYTKDALFFGSNPRLYVGHPGIKAYFDDVIEGYLQDAAFHDQHAYFVLPDIIAFSSYVDFTVFENDVVEVQFFRISLCLKRTEDGWKIAHHHAARIFEIENRAVVPPESNEVTQ